MSLHKLLCYVIISKRRKSFAVQIALISTAQIFKGMSCLVLLCTFNTCALLKWVHVVVIFGKPLSPKLKYEDGVTKSLLKKIMQPHLDESILKRKKKGFSNPYMEYLVNSGKLELIHEVNEQTGFFKRDKLDEYVQGASTGKFKQHVWGLYVLSYWIKKNLL